MMVRMTDLKAAVAEYEAAVEAATRKRDESIRAAHDAGKRQVDIVAETGYTRETVRQICMPAEKREALRAKRRKS